MVVTSADMIFNDTASQVNKELTDYIDRNLETIIMRAQLKFKFKIARPKDLKTLRSQGIKRLPVMIVNGKPVIGVPNIVEFLRKRVRGSKTTAAPKSEEEVMAEYFRKELGGFQKDSEGKFILPPDEGPDNGPDLQSLYAQERNRRGFKENNDEYAGNRYDRPQPRQPSRETLGDTGRVDYEQEMVTNPRPMAPRHDNLGPAPEDPVTTLQKLSQGSPAADQRDDEMMMALLERMGGDDGGMF